MTKAVQITVLVGLFGLVVLAVSLGGAISTGWAH